jgi:hypothetical protein
MTRPAFASEGFHFVMTECWRHLKLRACDSNADPQIKVLDPKGRYGENGLSKLRYRA